MLPLDLMLPFLINFLLKIVVHTFDRAENTYKRRKYPSTVNCRGSKPAAVNLTTEELKT